jgi:hypothetical protein
VYKNKNDVCILIVVGNVSFLWQKHDRTFLQGKNIYCVSWFQRFQFMTTHVRNDQFDSSHQVITCFWSLSLKEPVVQMLMGASGQIWRPLEFEIADVSRWVGRGESELKSWDHFGHLKVCSKCQNSGVLNEVQLVRLRIQKARF